MAAKSIYRPESRVLGEMLREHRKKTGLNQTDLGAEFGKSQRYISSVECGRTVPDVLELRDHCAALGQDFIGFLIQLEERIASKIVRETL